MEEYLATTSPRVVGISIAISHAPMREGMWLTFSAPTSTTRLAYYRSTSLGPYFSNPTPTRVVFRPFCVRRLFVSDFLLCFLRPLHLQQPSLTFKDPTDPTGNRALLFQLVFSLLWLPKGAHPQLRELFLHLTSIRSTSTSLRQPNLYPFRLLPRPVIPLLAFHIHLDPGFLILEPLIIFLVIKIFFSSLAITSPLSMIILANGSQTMAKGIGLAYPLPSKPLTSVLFVSDCPFNPIFINKLTRDLNYLITFSNNSVTLQDRSTGRTIGIGSEFYGLFHLSSPSSSIACASMNTSLLIHSHLSHSNISKFRIMVPRFSSLSSIECESC